MASEIMQIRRNGKENDCIITEIAKEIQNTTDVCFMLDRDGKEKRENTV